MQPHFASSSPSSGGISFPLSLHFLQTGKSCMWVPQHFASSILSPERQPYMRTHSTSLSLTFSGPRQPCGQVLQHPASCSHIPGRGVTYAHAAQWVHESTPCSTCWFTVWVEVSLVCMLWCSPVLLDASQEGWLGNNTGPCKSAREPGWSFHLQSTCTENVNNGTYWFLPSWVVPAAPENLYNLPTFSMWFPCLLVGLKLFN